MRSQLHCSTLCILLAFSGAAIAQEAAPQAATSTEATAQASATVAPAADSKIGAPAEGKGQIVFFRPSKFTGAAIGFKVREGDTELGKLRNGEYFVINVEPGTH